MDGTARSARVLLNIGRVRAVHAVGMLAMSCVVSRDERCMPDRAVLRGTCAARELAVCTPALATTSHDSRSDALGSGSGSPGRTLGSGPSALTGGMGPRGQKHIVSTRAQTLALGVTITRVGQRQEGSRWVRRPECSSSLSPVFLLGPGSLGRAQGCWCGVFSTRHHPLHCTPCFPATRSH